MTQEEKQLLLKDLCARLSYGVKYNYGGNEGCDYTMDRISLIAVDDAFPLEDVKPYLRPMSSITEEEVFDYVANTKERGCIAELPIQPRAKSTDWLNANHFDYRGLIEKGLALEAPENMYKTE